MFFNSVDVLLLHPYHICIAAFKSPTCVRFTTFISAFPNFICIHAKSTSKTAKVRLKILFYQVFSQYEGAFSLFIVYYISLFFSALKGIFLTMKTFSEFANLIQGVFKRPREFTNFLGHFRFFTSVSALVNNGKSTNSHLLSLSFFGMEIADVTLAKFVEMV